MRMDAWPCKEVPGPPPEQETTVKRDILVNPQEARNRFGAIAPFYKSLVILRGLPGQGKSTWVQLIKTAVASIPGAQTRVCSADHYFTDEEGNYNYIPDEIPKAHQQCEENARQALRDGVSIVIIDNTNVKRRNFRQYVKMAEFYGYNIMELTVGNLDVDVSEARNTHSVPRATLEKMADNLSASWKRKS